MDRREFLTNTTSAAAAMALAANTVSRARGARTAANDRITVAVTGVRGRGNNLLQEFARRSDVEVKYICDLDRSVLEKRVEETQSATGRRPEGIKDFRRALDDANVDALVLGTPDHWHAIPTIMACQAGKDVYVEKPDGHNILEGRTMVAAARKHGRIVQLGTQLRSSPHLHRAMAYIAEGHLGRALFAKAWESTKQGSIGRPADSEPPKGVDYDLWLGPAPKRPFNVRRFHANWRWFFDYGSGDLGNDGVHRLDMARWALATAVEANGAKLPAIPRHVSALGGKYYFDDAQEWPDTLQVTYDYPGWLLTYELKIWNPYPYHSEGEGAIVYGDQGYIVIGNRRWRAYGAKGERLAEDSGELDTAAHVENFIDCMRTREKPNADLETVGHPSSLLCHLGNVAWRTGRTLEFDAATGRFVDDEEANGYLTRPEYRSPWQLPKIEEL